MDSYMEMRSKVSDLMMDIGNLLGDITEGPRSQANFAEGDPNITLQLDLQLTSFFKHLHALKRRKDEPLSLAILALTKSGKSTLINSLLSSEAMPMNNVPETARLVRIVHTPNSPISLQEGDVEHKGAMAVKQRLQELNSEMRYHDVLTPSASCSPPASLSCTFMGPSSSPGQARQAGLSCSDEIITINAPITALTEYDDDTRLEEPPRLCLLDTPGPNEAGEEKLKFTVERLLDDVDAVLYLLDYTKLKTLEEENMLRRLKEINPRLLRRLAQRLFFVVNKVDSMHTSEGLGSDETREYVADLVTRQLECEGFILRPEQVLLVSARNALLSRLVLSDRATEDSMRRFLTLAFGYSATSTVGANTRSGVNIHGNSAIGAAASRGAAGRQRTPRQPPPISLDQVVHAAHAMLEDSGIEDMEQQVLAFLYTHGAGVKLMALVDDISRLLQSVSNVAVSCHACLTQNVASLEKEAGELKTTLQGTLDTFDEVMRDTSVVSEEVTQEIRSHLQSLRGRLFTQIVQVLDTDAASVAAAQSASAASQAVAGSEAPTVTPPRWQRIRQKVLSMFTSVPAGTSEGVASVGVPTVARSKSKEEMAKQLRELHEDLMSQINTDVTEFWHVLEACTNARHSELLSRINTNLELLARRIENDVESKLEVRLQPVNLSMRQPSASDFHSDLQQLIGKGIVETRQKHIRVAERQYQERVLRHHGEGICKWGTYWETIPRTRTVVESYSITMFELQAGEVASHFIQIVHSAIESSEKALSHYVSTFVQKQLEEARKEVQEYSKRYLSAVSGALEASTHGTEYRQAALKQVEGYMDQIESIKKKLATVQAEAELQVPHIQDAEAYDDMDMPLEELEMLSGSSSHHVTSAVLPGASPDVDRGLLGDAAVAFPSFLDPVILVSTAADADAADALATAGAAIAAADVASALVAAREVGPEDPSTYPLSIAATPAAAAPAAAADSAEQGFAVAHAQSERSLGAAADADASDFEGAAAAAPCWAAVGKQLGTEQNVEAEVEMEAEDGFEVPTNYLAASGLSTHSQKPANGEAAVEEQVQECRCISNATDFNSCSGELSDYGHDALQEMHEGGVKEEVQEVLTLSSVPPLIRSSLQDLEEAEVREEEKEEEEEAQFAVPYVISPFAMAPFATASLTPATAASAPDIADAAAGATAASTAADVAHAADATAAMAAADVADADASESVTTTTFAGARTDLVDPISVSVEVPTEATKAPASNTAPAPATTTALGVDPTTGTALGVDPTTGTALGVDPTTGTALGVDPTTATALGVAPATVTALDIAPAPPPSSAVLTPSVPVPDGRPFDYNSGFALAMSTSELVLTGSLGAEGGEAGGGPTGSEGGEEEWMFVEGGGSDEARGL